MFTFGGLASGLDTNTIIQQLISIERLPIHKLEAQKATEQSRLDLIGTLSGLVKSLQTNAAALSSSDSFLSYTASVSHEGIANVSTTGEAQSGSHTLTVEQLAQADRWSFNGVTDPSVNLASADGESVSFSVNGTSYNVPVTAAGSSLYDISAAINMAAGDDVTSSVVNAGTQSSPDWQLVLASDETGTDFAVSGLSSSIAGLTLDGTAGGPNHVVQASNAIVVIDGITIERATNNFNDVLEGVSIDLLSADPTQEVTIQVGADSEAITQKIQDLVDSYNDVVGFINEQNTYTEEGGAGGDLFGDNLLSQVKRSIDSALFDVDIATVQADTEGYSTLGLIGIDRENDGTLSVDSDKLSAKLDGNLDAIVDLFADLDGFDNAGAAENTPGYFTDTGTVDSGLASSLDRAIDAMFGILDNVGGSTINGIFDSRKDSINARIERFNDRIEDRETYIIQYESRLIRRFTALEELMSGLNSQGAALQNALSGLN
jgi:flagellar hook-associated protein 2